MVVTAPAPWHPLHALDAYRATMWRIADWYDAADVFDKPSLQRRDVVAADAACQAAWTRQDMPALTAALARWEHAITGTAP